LPQGHGYRGSRPAVLHRYDVPSAPVSGFGIILSIVGFALAKDRFQIISAAYLVSIVAVIIYQVPWREWVFGSAT
jgi:hypothetical protein